MNAWSAKAIDQADQVDTRIRYRGTLGRADAITTATAAILEAANLHKTELDLQGVPASDLPEALGELNQLTSLSIMGSEATALPGSIGNLQQLEVLQLAGNPKLTKLPDLLVRLVGLKRLVVRETPLESLLRDIGNMTELREISLSGGTYPTLPDSIILLPLLETLRVEGPRGEGGLTRLPHNLGMLASLKTLEISQHTSLFALPDSIWQLKNLVTLSVKDCPMVMLPGRLDELQALQTLSLSGCDKLVRLPDSITSIHPWLTGAQPERVHRADQPAAGDRPVEKPQTPGLVRLHLIDRAALVPA